MLHTKNTLLGPSDTVAYELSAIFATVTNLDALRSGSPACMVFFLASALADDQISSHRSPCVVLLRQITRRDKSEVRVRFTRASKIEGENSKTYKDVNKE